MLMPLIWMKRGLPSENTVPAMERSRCVGDHGQLDIAVEAPVLSCVVVEISMPRSLAITGAETMFTSGLADFMMPAMARSQRLEVHLGDTPS
jgi:hypothetical protein